VNEKYGVVFLLLQLQW